MHSAIVTGATGYIGRHLVKRLAAAGCAVHAIIRPSSDKTVLKTDPGLINIHIYDGTYDSLEKILLKANANVVFHTAACAVYSHSSATLPVLLEANFIFGSYLLEAMRQTGHTCLINTGTYWQHLTGEEYEPVCLYAAHKQALEAIIDYYAQAHGLNAITLKLFDVYGPDDPRPKLFNLFKKATESGIALDMSPGEQLVDFIYIDDVIDAYIRAADYAQKNPSLTHQRFFVGTGQPHTLKNIVDLYNSLQGQPVPVNWSKRPYRSREVMQPQMGQTLPGWQAKTTIAMGIRKLLDI